ncbi:MAG TPA: hypothetical protein VK789_00950, partial [Bryobacteraceae bacterium]|nr:hypothetical protein [Bryobacteraceae bacterium]
MATLVSFASSARAQNQESPSTSLVSEVTEMRAENGDVRELLRKIQEQQKSLDEHQKSIDEQQKDLAALIGKLQRLLDGGTATNVSIVGKPIVPLTAADASAPGANAALNTPQAVTGSASTPVPQTSVVASQTDDDHY